ncbi:MAG: class II aldolase/adducin family protein, partial [Chloroflexi bacterium]
MQAAGSYLLAHGLTWGTSGNVSVRLGAEAFLVTASGTDLGSLGPDDFVACPLAEGNAPGETLGGYGRRPSKEAPMHRAI